MNDDLETAVKIAEARYDDAQSNLQMIESEARAAGRIARHTRAKVEQCRVELEEAKRKLAESKKPPYPPAMLCPFSRISIKHGPRWYDYLVAYVPHGGYYTTGTRDESKHFRTWEAFVDWVRAQSGHGTMVPLMDDPNASDLRISGKGDFGYDH